jgi:V8-like Glu-specific endopeptidase
MTCRLTGWSRILLALAILHSLSALCLATPLHAERISDHTAGIARTAAPAVSTAPSANLICTPLQEDDGSFENAYGWNFGDVAPPNRGAFAKHFTSPFPGSTVLLCETSFFFTTIPAYPQGAAHYDAIVYAHDTVNGRPGAEIMRISDIDPGPVGIFPVHTQHVVDFGGATVPSEFWIAFWPRWAGAELQWFLSADENGAAPTPPDHTIATATGGVWVPVNAPGYGFENNRNVGIRCQVRDAQGLDPETPIGHEEPRNIASGPYSNPGPNPATVFTTTVAEPGAAWIRIHFDLFAIGPDDYVRFTSMLDGETYRILGRHATEAPGEYYSYPLNGGAVTVELVAAPGSGPHPGIHIDWIDVGDLPLPLDSICGPTDDRTASSDPRVARMKVKKGDKTYVCTAFLISDNGCFLTAGHCLDGADLTKAGSVVTQFNTPASTSGGATQNPPAADQFKLDTDHPPCFSNGGKGDDYGVFKAAPNEKSGENPGSGREPFPLKSSAPAVGDSARVTGHGADDGAANFTQQTHGGTVTGVNGNTVSHNADTRGGNSGSPIINASGGVSGIHTHGGCDESGGSNSGTAITHPGLQACIEQVCAKGCLLLPRRRDDFDSGALVSVTIPSLGVTTAVALSGMTSVQRADPLRFGDLYTIPTEIVAMNLTGVSCLGPLTLAQAANRPSLGRLDQIDPADCYPLDAYFDVFFVLTVNGLTLHNESPLHMSVPGGVNSIPPYGATFVSSGPVQLMNEQGQPVGTLLAADHTPRPPHDCFQSSVFIHTDRGLIQAQGPVEVVRGAARFDGPTQQWTVETEMIAMNLIGDSPLGPVRIREAPTRHSLGRILYPDYETFPATAFFDVFVEIEVGTQTLCNQVPMQMVATIHALPPTGDPFQSQGPPVPLVDCQMQVPVATMLNVLHMPQEPFACATAPPPGDDHFCSMAAVQVDLGQGPFTVGDLSGPTTVRRGSPLTLSDGRIEIPIEMIQLDLTSLSSPLGVHLNPQVPSLGRASQIENGPLYPLDSFFDVFVVIESPFGQLHNNEPLRMRAPITSIPPGPMPPFQSQNPVQLYDAQNVPRGILLGATHTPGTPYTTDCAVPFDCRPLPGGVEEPPAAPPVLVTALHAAIPNPFSGGTALGFDLRSGGQATLRIYDLAGRLVATLADGEFPAQTRHVAVWDGTDREGRPAGSGIYFARLDAEGVTRTQKLVLLR